jgi:hypothetical protein
LATIQGLRRTGSPRFALYQLAYHRARVSYYRALSESERQVRRAITSEYRSRGGMIGYLGLDHPSRVESLTRSFTWDLDGLAVLHRLLHYRHDHGEPMERWSVASNGRNSGRAEQNAVK